VLTMHPTLLIGPADWDAARMPREEFAARIAAMWEVCDPDVPCVIVFGSARHHAELAWLTHFTPKLEPALALIERNGAVRLFVGGGINMLDAARPLTWVDELLPLRRAPKAIAESMRESGGAGQFGMIGGDAMPLDFRRDLMDAQAQDADRITIDIAPRLAPLMCRKRTRELAAIRQSCVTLATALAVLGAASRSGAAVAVAVLAAEAAANRAGAQDVRTLVSLDGGRTLLPFTGPDARRIDPLQVYVAVRQHGYWAEGFAMFSTSPSAAQLAAGAVLRAGVATARPGLPRRALVELLTMQPLHPVVAQAPVAAIGLALEDTWPEVADDEVLVRDSVYSLRAGIISGSEAAIVSAMLAITADGAEVLWVQE
jgi:hypothetical protein